MHIIHYYGIQLPVDYFRLKFIDRFCAYIREHFGATSLLAQNNFLNVKIRKKYYT